MSGWSWAGYDARRAARQPPQDLEPHRTLQGGVTYEEARRRNGALLDELRRAERAAADLKRKLTGSPGFIGVGVNGNERDGYELRVMARPVSDVPVPGSFQGFPVTFAVVGQPGRGPGLYAEATPIERLLERQGERRRRAQADFESDEFGVGVKGSPETYRMSMIAQRVCSCGQRLGAASVPTVVMRGCQRCHDKQEGQPLLGFPGMWGAILGEELRPHVLAQARLGRGGDTLGKWKAPVELQHEMRQAVLQAWAEVAPEITPTPGAIMAIQSIGYHESDYGRGWGGQGKGSNNMGAYQCKCRPEGEVCCDGCFLYQDSRPTKDGQVKYMWCYKRYPTPAAGFADIIKLFKNSMKGVWRVLPCGNLDEIAWRMRLAGYFEGFTTDKRKAAQAYAEALNVCARYIAEALGEPQAAWRMGEQYENSNGCPAGAGDAGGADDAQEDWFTDTLLPVGGGLALAAAATWYLAPELLRSLWR